MCREIIILGPRFTAGNHIKLCVAPCRFVVRKDALARNFSLPPPASTRRKHENELKFVPFLSPPGTFQLDYCTRNSRNVQFVSIHPRRLDKELFFNFPAELGRRELEVNSKFRGYTWRRSVEFEIKGNRLEICIRFSLVVSAQPRPRLARNLGVPAILPHDRAPLFHSPSFLSLNAARFLRSRDRGEDQMLGSPAEK